MAMLPWEIIVEEILPKLPARSLLRFKTVSKSFKTTISSPNFANLHLRQSHSSDANRFLIINIGKEGLQLIDLDSPENPPLPLPIPTSFRPNLTYPIVGICNGLLLISGRVHGADHTCRLLLINAATGFSTVIWSYPLCWFGFDAVVGDYKFVRFVGADLMIKKLNDRHWEKSAATFEVNKRPCSKGVVLNNHLFHWLSWYSLESKLGIMCFDLCSATWTQDVPLPINVCRDRPGDVTNLGVFDGCLTVSTINTGFVGYDVWVMKEYGVAGSWVKLFTFPDQKFTPITYARGSNSKVLIHTGNKLIWYNISNKNKRCELAGIHDIHGVHGIGFVLDSWLFKESLVTVPSGEL